MFQLPWSLFGEWDGFENFLILEQRKNYLKSIEGANEEAREVLDQMTIEVSNLPSNQKIII